MFHLLIPAFSQTPETSDLFSLHNFAFSNCPMIRIIYYVVFQICAYSYDQIPLEDLFASHWSEPSHMVIPIQNHWGLIIQIIQSTLAMRWWVCIPIPPEVVSVKTACRISPFKET